MWIQVYPNWKSNFNSTNGNKRCSCYETKTSISLIPTRRMCLWRPIMKRKEIIMWIHVDPNWKSDFNSTNGKKRCFCYETKASISLIPRGRMHLWCPIMEEKKRRLLCESMFIPTEIWTSILKMDIREVFLMNPKHQYHLFHWRECVYVAQSEKKGDYYVNPSLSQLKVELQFYKWQ